MAYNPYQMLRELLPDPLLLVGTVRQVGPGIVIVEMPGGGTLQVRGEADIGDYVFFRNGVVESKAASLPVVLINV